MLCILLGGAGGYGTLGQVKWVHGTLTPAKLNYSSLTQKIPFSHIIWFGIFSTIATISPKHAAIRKCHRLGYLNTQQKFISHSSGGWKFGIRCQHGWVLIRAFFGVARGQVLFVPSHGGRSKRGAASSLGTPKRALTQSPHPNSTLMTSNPKDPPHWGAGFNIFI